MTWELSARARHLVQRTLARAAVQAGVAMSAGSEPDAQPPHPAYPAVGSSATTRFVVESDDLAANMGHPDPTMAVLGSPRIALWFELATSELMPKPAAEVRHVGVGILVHHLGRAAEGETVAVRVEVDDVVGRSCVFACTAHVADRLVATGTHHRVVLGSSVTTN